MKSLKYLIIFILSGLFLPALAQQPFTAGNFVVYRTGDGTTTMAGEIAPVFIDEYTPDGVLVQSIPMPTTTVGSNNLLTVRSTLGKSKSLNLSANGKYLLLSGINIAPGPFVVPTASVLGVIDFNGNVSTSTVVTDFTEALHNPTAVVSDDGNRLWMTGSSVVRYTTAGSTSSVLLNNSSGTTAALAIANGQLYVGKSGVPFIYRVGNGLPSAPDQTLTGLPITVADISSGGQFAFADLNPNVPGVDVLYLASVSSSEGPAAGIRKFSLVDGNWVENGSVGGEVASSNYRGLTIRVSGNTVTIFSTRQGDNSSSAGGGDLVKLTDNSGYNGTLTGTPTLLASIINRFGAVNVASFGGLALVPVGCPRISLIQVPEIAATQARVVWSASGESADGYEYTVSTSSVPPASGTLTADTSVIISGLSNGTMYYVHVRSRCSATSVSEWNTVIFETGCKPPPVTLLNVEINSNGRLTAKWNKVFGASAYEYSISTETAPPSSGIALTDTAFTVSDLNSVTQYYLHVRSGCEGGAFSSWTSKPFTTGCFMPAPAITELSTTAGVKWNKIANAVKYEYALTKTPAFPPSGHTVTDTAYLINKIDEGTAYYFHVRAACSTGSVSQWSTIQLITQGLQVYPNPVKDVMQIRINGIINSSSEVLIGNAMGRIVARIKLTNSSASVSTKGWAAGIYLVRYDDGKNKYAARIVKQ